MKKTICFVTAILMLVAVIPFSVAADEGDTLVIGEFKSLTINNDATYQYMQLSEKCTLTVATNKTVALLDGGNMALLRGNICLESGASWIGSNVTLNSPAAALVKMREGAKIDISFASQTDAIAFSGILISNKIECARYGNRIVAPCVHDNIAQRNVCLDCGHIYPETAPPVGSVLSEGSVTVIVGVACLAVGFLVAMFIFKKKKKPATENNAEE